MGRLCFLITKGEARAVSIKLPKPWFASSANMWFISAVRLKEPSVVILPAIATGQGYRI
jgi:hypothetical protein